VLNTCTSNTNSMEKLLWFNSSSAAHESTEPTFYKTWRSFRHIYIILCPDSILSQINLSHTLPLCFLKVNFNIIFPSPTRSHMWFLIFRFSPGTILYAFLIYPTVMTAICPCATRYEYLPWPWGLHNGEGCGKAIQ